MRFVSCVFVTLTAILCIIWTTPSDASATYRSRSLGIRGEAYAINNAGQIVGSMYVGDNYENHAFFWSQSTGVIDLGLGYARDINNEGRVVGYNDSNMQVFTWKLGESINYLGVGGAYSINDLGWIAGNSDGAGVVWKPSGEKVIVLEGDVCRDINNNCVVTGTVMGSRPYTWTESTGLNLFPTPPAGEHNVAWCINDNGQIAGHNTGGTTWACMWQSDHSEGQYLANIGLNSNALGINNKGQIVGYYGSGYNACLWNPDGTVTNLAALVPTSRSRAFDINDNSVVVGIQDNGSLTNMNVVIWEPVPEPASIIALSAGLLGFLPYLKRKKI